MKYEDIQGRTFGKWTTSLYAGRGRWICTCACGTKREIQKSSLLLGATKSCGCTRNVVHGHCSKRTKTTEYSIWANIVQRCYNPKANHYEDYGGRGITMCDRWRTSFQHFYQDMGPRPEGMTVERENNNGNYEPGNCKWATMEEQHINTRVTIRITLNNETKLIKEWAEITGLSAVVIRDRFKRGHSPERILLRKVGEK